MKEFLLILLFPVLLFPSHKWDKMDYFIGSLWIVGNYVDYRQNRDWVYIEPVNIVLTGSVLVIGNGLYDHKRKSLLLGATVFMVPVIIKNFLRR